MSAKADACLMSSLFQDMQRKKVPLPITLQCGTWSKLEVEDIYRPICEDFTMTKL